MKTIIRALAAAVCRAPKMVLVISLVISGILGFFATQVQTSTGQDGFAPRSDELLAAERIEELFGETASQTVMQVVVRGREDALFSAEAVRILADAEVTIRASDAGEYLADGTQQPAVVSYLLPVFASAQMQGVDPATFTDAQVRDLFTDAVTSDENSFAQQLVAPTNTPARAHGLLLVFINASQDLDEQTDRESAISEALATVETGGVLELRPFSFGLLFGDEDAFASEVGGLFALAFAIIIAVLLFVYWMQPRSNTRIVQSIRRTIADTSVTMLTIILAITWMNGIGALLQRLGWLQPFSEVAQIVPILLIGLGVDYGIHLTSRYRDQVGRGDDVVSGMRTAIGTVGVALVLATVTTSVGFLTNIWNPIPALRDFGILASIGIVVAFILMLTFVPALRSLLDQRAERFGRLPVDGLGATRDRLLPELVGRTSVLAERFPVPTLIVFFVLGGAGFVGFSNLSTEFSFTDFLPEDSPVVETFTILTEEFSGGFGETTQVLVEDTDLSDVSVFNTLSRVNRGLAAHPDVLSVSTPDGDVPRATSIFSIAQSLYALTPEGQPAFPEFVTEASALGYDPASGTVASSSGMSTEDGNAQAFIELVASYAPEELDAVIHFADDVPVAGLITLQTQAGEDRALALRVELAQVVAPLAATGASVAVTSQNIIGAAIVEELSATQLQSLIITIVVAMLVLILTFGIENRRPFLGVITITPVVLVVMWTFGLMYLSGIPFGPVTATLTGLAVGIGLPYTIHIARRFLEDRDRYTDIGEAIRETTRNTGGALAGSAFTTAAGFGVLTTSSLTPFQQMGQVTAYAIALSLVGSVLALPSMLVLWERWHRRRGSAMTPRTESVLAD
ncbi:MAG: MMPL family transporter [Nitriliruptoraceae bacterium]